MSSHSMDIGRFPLRGSALIEASAGTGKTFTLAMLYLRLVLQHGQEGGRFIRPLQPQDILVVTFTKAATEELRTRIRQRLVEAAMVFALPKDQQPAADPMLLALKAEIPELEHPSCVRRLQLAAQSMDMAAIATIHSWCYRMLDEHAFACGQTFGLQLDPNHRPWLEQSLADYWRSFYLPLSGEALALLLAEFSGPSALLKAISPVLNLPLDWPETEPPEALVLRHQSERLTLSQTLKAEFQQQGHLEQIRTIFEQGSKNKSYSARSLNTGHREKFYSALAKWLADDSCLAPNLDLKSKTWQRFCDPGGDDFWQQAPVPTGPCFEALARLQVLMQPAKIKPELIYHACRWVQERLQWAKAQQGVLGHQDLLSRLHDALHGPQAEALAAAIAQKFPVALVDEFQDTDPVQYGIFQAIYRPQNQLPDQGFFMIGDPKQAIYAFRGADIHTYLQAKSHTQGRHFSLDTNHRSQAQAVKAVNELFLQGEQNPQGAFLFGAGRQSPLPFVPAHARQQGPGLRLQQQPAAGLHYWLLASESPLTKADSNQQCAQQAANQITELLKLSLKGQASLPCPDQGQRPVQAQDIAVLVNNGDEADLVRQALRRLGLGSVYRSDKSNVFSTWLAGELLTILKALLEPNNERRLRTALATRLLCSGLDELARLNADEQHWENQLLQFSDYHSLWQRQGILPVLLRLLKDYQVAQRLMATDQGERDLTDFLHLGELLQSASRQLDGEQALVRYLSDQRLDPDDGNDSLQQRLESDQDLIQVVTVHKSKGLEYPLVFLPFLLNARTIMANKLPLQTHDPEGQLQIHWQADDAILAQADQERLAEDVRKLYVALTRARFANFVFLAPNKGGEQSGLGYLLNLAQQPLPQALSLLPSWHAQPWATEAPAPYQQPPQPALTAARTAQLRPHRPWWIASYSALSHSSSQSPGPAPDDLAQDLAQELHDEPATVDPDILPQADMHSLARGSRPGTFLHSLLEWCGRHQRLDTEPPSLGFAAALADTQARQQMLQQGLNLRGWQDWFPALDQWLCQLLSMTWRESGLCLSALQPQQFQVELEFLLASHQVASQALDRRVCQAILPGQGRPQLDAKLVNGLLKGFIDLVVEHQGRFYVIDWKSNYLGPRDDDYHQDSMTAVVLKKRYDLQLVLYSLALHRLLKQRLANYSFEQHFGGGIYVFLRGLNSPSQGLWQHRPSQALIEQLDQLFAGQELHHEPQL